MLCITIMRVQFIHPSDALRVCKVLMDVYV